LLVTGSDDGAVRFWNPASGSTIMLKNHTNTVSCMTMCHLQRNHFLITGGYDGKVGFWDVSVGVRCGVLVGCGGWLLMFIFFVSLFFLSFLHRMTSFLGR
jgi:WD40 repeat protein